MPVHTIGVIGAGTMGSGIAQAAATKGFDVILIDMSEAAVAKGIDAVESRLARMVAKGKMSGSEQEAALGGHPRHHGLRGSQACRCRHRSCYRKLRSKSENSQTNRSIG